MSYFSWLSKKPVPAREVFVQGGAAGNANRSAVLLSAAATPASMMPAAQAGTSRAAAPPGIERKVRRHARREQLYVAIRESMTRAGMLSATYRFKVLSLDQNGDQFLVMMDVAAELTTGPAKLSHTEEILIQTAKAGYGIIVTAVYWRFDIKPVSKPLAVVVAESVVPPKPAALPAPASAPEIEITLPSRPHADPYAITQTNTRWVPEPSHHDPLLEAEVAAFKRALASAPLHARPVGPTAPAVTSLASEPASKIKDSHSKSYARMTGFEDTEVPGAAAVPALSPTQYGELN